MTEPAVPTPQELEARANEQLARMQEAAREAAAVTATARTADGHATVVVGYGGAVRSIEVRPEAMQGSAAQLGPALVAAISSATGEVARRGAEILTERTGVDLTSRVLAAQVEAGDPVALDLADQRSRTEGTAVAEAGDVDWLDDGPR